MISAKKLLLFLAVGAAAAGVWWGVDLLTRPPEQATPAFSAKPGDKPGKSAAPLSASAAHAPSSTPVAAGTPIEDQVRDAAGDPDKSFEAFKKIQDCLTLESEKEVVDDQQVKVSRQDGGLQIQLVQHKADEQALALLRKSCAGLTGRTRMDRFQLLTYAVDHYVAGSLGVYIFYGPNGDRESLANWRNDPVVAEWRNDALRRLDERIALGYTDALLAGVGWYQMLGKDLALADTYAEYLAVNKVMGAINGDEGVYPKSLLDAWAKELGADKQSEAEAKADRIFLAWKQRKAASHVRQS